jgi:hypothetical protein
LNHPSLRLSNNVSHISTKLTHHEKTILMIWMNFLVLPKLSQCPFKWIRRKEIVCKGH